MKNLGNRIILFGLASWAAQGNAFEIGKYRSPELAAPDQFEHAIAQGDAEQLNHDWWTLFEDRELTALVEAALVKNQDLAASAYRVEQARAAVGQARSSLYPQLAVDAVGSRGQSLESGYRESNYARLPGVLSYEVDLWGGVRKGVKAAHADVEAESLRHEAYRLSVSGQVAKTVFLYRATVIEEGIVARTVETRSAARELIADRVSLGSAAEFDLARAETELANAEADLAETRLRRRQLANALAVLVGEMAPGFERTVVSTDSIPKPPTIPSGIPAEALVSRPDVLAAERVLEASANRIGVAKSAFFPSIRLTGTAGWESDDLDDFLSSEKRVWSFGPQVYLPLFQGGRNKARLAKAVARFEEQGAAFQQTVLLAMKEVQDSLDAARFLKERDGANDRAASAARRAAELSQTRYDEGFVSYLEVVDSERAALAAERAQVSLKALRVLATIDLIQSLGGGWNR